MLIVFAFLAIILASWLYKEQGSLDNPITLSASNIEYEATGIHALQTNHLGEVDYLLKADKLTHYMDSNTDQMDQVNVKWRSQQNQGVTLQAQLASLNHDSGDIVMKDNVVLSSYRLPSKEARSVDSNDNNSSDSGAITPHSVSESMVLNAQTLLGNIHRKTLLSNQPIMVKQGDNSFEANSFQADLATGEYEFAQIAMTFMPPTRQDKPLF